MDSVVETQVFQRSFGPCMGGARSLTEETEHRTVQLHISIQG